MSAKGAREANVPRRGDCPGKKKMFNLATDVIYRVGTKMYIL